MGFCDHLQIPKLLIVICRYWQIFALQNAAAGPPKLLGCALEPFLNLYRITRRRHSLEPYGMNGFPGFFAKPIRSIFNFLQGIVNFCQFVSLVIAQRRHQLQRRRIARRIKWIGCDITSNFVEIFILTEHLLEQRALALSQNFFINASFSSLKGSCFAIAYSPLFSFVCFVNTQKCFYPCENLSAIIYQRQNNVKSGKTKNKSQSQVFYSPSAAKKSSAERALSTPSAVSPPFLAIPNPKHISFNPSVLWASVLIGICTPFSRA